MIECDNFDKFISHVRFLSVEDKRLIKEKLLTEIPSFTEGVFVYESDDGVSLPIKFVEHYGFDRVDDVVADFGCHTILQIGDVYLKFLFCYYSYNGYDLDDVRMRPVVKKTRTTEYFV